MSKSKLHDLSPSLIEWMRRRRDTTDWVYHPRKPDVSDYIRRKFVADLLAESGTLRDSAQRGDIACDLNPQLKSTTGRARKLDLVVGRPIAIVEATTAEELLRKARIATPLLTLEIKLCMTEHRKATSRLIDELHASLDVVRAVHANCIAIAIVVLNVAEKFTSPLRLPGPNMHQRPIEISRLAAKVFERVPMGEGGYDGLAMALIDVDNETRFEIGFGIEVPDSHSYVQTVRRVATLWYDRNVRQA